MARIDEFLERRENLLARHFDHRMLLSPGSTPLTWRNTFSVIRETSLSYSLWERLPSQQVELTEKTGPLPGVSR